MFWAQESFWIQNIWTQLLWTHILLMTKISLSEDCFWPQICYTQKLFLDKNLPQNFHWWENFLPQKIFFWRNIFKTNEVKNSAYQVLLHSNPNALDIAVWLWCWPNLLYLFYIFWDDFYRIIYEKYFNHWKIYHFVQISQICGCYFICGQLIQIWVPIF